MQILSQEQWWSNSLTHPLHTIQWIVVSSLGILHLTHIFLLFSNNLINEYCFLNDFFLINIWLEKHMNFKIKNKIIISKPDMPQPIYNTNLNKYLFKLYYINNNYKYLKFWINFITLCSFPKNFWRIPKLIVSHFRNKIT